MTNLPLAERLRGKETRARARRVGVARWLRAHWAEVQEVRGQNPCPTWDAIAQLMREDGIEGATGRAAGQEHSRIARGPAEKRAPEAVKGVKTPSIVDEIWGAKTAEVREPISPSTSQPAPVSGGSLRKRLRRVGEQ